MDRSCDAVVDPGWIEMDTTGFRCGKNCNGYRTLILRTKNTPCISNRKSRKTRLGTTLGGRIFLTARFRTWVDMTLEWIPFSEDLVSPEVPDANP